MSKSDPEDPVSTVEIYRQDFSHSIWLNPVSIDE
jgi:hypothetical protein